MKSLWKHLWKNTSDGIAANRDSIAKIESDILSSLEELYRLVDIDLPNEISKAED